MGDVADRYRKVAAAFTARVEGVPEGRWDDPAPCEGWVARDVVCHLVEWMPSLFLDPFGIERPALDVDDPVASWRALDATIQRSLADPVVAAREADIRPGRFTFESAFASFGLPDVLVHTWDLARATGQDERLDAAEVAGLYEGILPADEVLRTSGHYGPKVDVADDADVQTKLLAFMGRTP